MAFVKTNVEARALINRTALALACIAMLLVLALSPVVNAVESEGIGAVPANPDPNRPRTSSIFVYEPKAGDTLKDGLKVINNTDKVKSISLYAVDSQLSSDGAFACKQAVEDKNNVGAWVKISQSEVKLKPLETKIVDFTVKIPKGVDAGEHNGCIVIQDAESQTSQEVKGVVLSFRSAIRVAVTIDGDIQTNLVLKNTEHVEKTTKLMISPSYSNSGNVSLDTDIQVKIFNILGMTIGEAGGKFPVLARSDAKFNFELDRPYWGGIYKRTVSTNYARLSDQGTDIEPTYLKDNSQFLFVTPQPTALAIEVVALIATATATRKYLNNKKSLKQLHASTKPYTVKKGDDIQSLAKKHSVSWKVLAKINKLKAPYTLKAGQSIKIPSKQKHKARG